MAVSRTTSWHKQAEEIKDLNKARHSTHEMAEQSKAPPPQPLQQPRAQAPHAVGMATLHDAFGWELGAINGASYAVIIRALTSQWPRILSTLEPMSFSSSVY